MGMDIQIKPEEVFLNEDRRWLGTRMGTLDLRSITIDSSLFLDAHVAEKGALPSGTALAEYSPGIYGPYGAGLTDTDEVQTITRTSTGGTFTITFDGLTTGNIDASAAVTAAVINAALQAAGFAADEIVAAGAAGGPFTLTFGGQYADTDVPMAVVDDALATGGTVTIASTTQGVGGGGFAGLLFTTTVIDIVNASKIGVAMFWTGVVKVDHLPAFAGTTLGEVDATARAASAARIRWENAMNGVVV